MSLMRVTTMFPNQKQLRFGKKSEKFVVKRSEGERASQHSHQDVFEMITKQFYALNHLFSVVA